MQRVGSAPALPQHPRSQRGQCRLWPQWVPFLQRLSTTSSQGSRGWVHTAVAFGLSKLCLRPKVVLKFNLWSAWQGWEQWVATLTHHLKPQHRAGDSSEDFQAGPTIFHWVCYLLVQLCKIKFNFPCTEMKLPLIKHSSKIPTMTRDSSEKIFAYHNVFQAIKPNVLLINKGEAKNTEKTPAVFHSLGKAEWPILIKFSQDRTKNRSPRRFNKI